MSTQTSNRLVDAYLQELRKSAKSLPAGSRRELVDEITEHLDEALPADATETTTRGELARLGDPEQIVAEARERLEISGPTGRRFEWIALWLVLIGGFFLVVGWFVGVVMLWSSHAWTLRDKLLGTLVVPGGLAGAVFVVGDVVAGGSSGSCTSGVGELVEATPHGGASALAGGAGHAVTHCASSSSGWPGVLVAVLLLLLIIAPIVTAVYLGRRIRRVAEA